MSYCSITELKHYTGTSLDDDALGEFITQADREIDSYLLPRTALPHDSGVDNPVIKAASLKLAAANMFLSRMLFARQPMGYNTSELSSPDPSGTIMQLRKEAFGMLDNYIEYAKKGLEPEHKTYVVKVRGR